jgi:hypothetical protein
MTDTLQDHLVVDPRAAGALPAASAELVQLWSHAIACATGELPGMGLGAGDRPVADVDVLAGALAVVEYELARRLHAATMAGSLPLVGPGAVLAARGWAGPHARRLARAGALAVEHPSVAAAWAAGIITADHVDAIARNVGPLTPEQLAAVVAELGCRWGQLSPAGVTRFLVAAVRLLHPSRQDGPEQAESDAYAGRDLSFAVLGDTVLLSGALPRLEGEAVMAAVEALAERLRSTADHVPAGARRADALVELVNDAHACERLPSRGGLPVALTVTLEHTRSGDPIWTTSRGHVLTASEARWACCDPTVTPVLVASATDCVPEPNGPGGPGVGGGAAGRIAALAAALFDSRIPLAVGRTTRTATPAQRRALAARDKGCIIPGCTIPAESCQAHHIRDWAAGGASDLDNLALLCWTHHRQVDLQMWTIEPTEPDPGAPPGTAWPANNGSPWTIRRTHRTRWRL